MWSTPHVFYKYEGHLLVSQAEVFYLRHCLLKGIQIQSHPYPLCYVSNGNGFMYSPDFYLPKSNIYIEVKRGTEDESKTDTRQFQKIELLIADGYEIEIVNTSGQAWCTQRFRQETLSDTKLEIVTTKV